MSQRSRTQLDKIATSKAEADSQLEWLRKEKGFDGHSQANPTLVSCLDKALDLISDQLYQTPTRFLLELIQNADDNRYRTDVSPTLKLSLYKRNGGRYFRTDCNEVGFTLGQIDALVGLGKSTKTADRSSGEKRYIGEKGIGFKSVFKVADIVHVRSGNYEFKLNRDQSIGMLLPILSRFPSADLAPCRTQFLLEVRRRDDYTEIEREMGDVKPELLMFLRKLTRLELSAPGNHGPSIFKRRVQKSDPDFGGAETVTLLTTTPNVHSGRAPATKQKQYVLYRQKVQNLPQDPRREGISTSEISLAFPVADCYTPIAKTQNTFAFLPIDNFGFKFIIHADFLLVASREGLEYQRPWNLALLAGIRQGFLGAIRRFAHMPRQRNGAEQRDKGLCFTWPKYVERGTRGSRFWDRLHTEIISDLKRAPLLSARNRKSDFYKPGLLRYVPSQYRFGVGDLDTLFDLPSKGPGWFHLAFEYDDVYQVLSRDLGVKTLSLSELCTEFEYWVAQVGTAGIKKKPVAWHKRVSQVFKSGTGSVRKRLRRLPIIPLQNGAWVSADSGRVYLDFDSGDKVPVDLDISVVDPTATQDQTRRRFLEFLGIGKYNPRDVCDAIIELHRNLDNRATENLISDAAYLFKHRSLLNRHDGPPAIFFVVIRDGKFEKRKRPPIYCDDSRTTPNLIGKYRDSPGSPFWTLDSAAYEANICAGEVNSSARDRKMSKFFDWLLRSPTFSSVPILAQNDRLTEAWDFLADENVVDLLHALGHCVDSTSKPPRVLDDEAPELRVRCRDGKSRRLGLLALPTEDLMRECPHIDFVDLPGPSRSMESKWGFLSRFGVLCTCDTTARLRELEALRERFVGDEVDEEAVHEIYRALNSAPSADEEEIQDAFRGKTILLIPEKNHRRWVQHDSCVWKAPSILRFVITLRSYYRDCKRLFVTVLKVKEAGLSHVLHDFCCTFEGNQQRAVQRFEKICSELARFRPRRRDLDPSQLKSIRRARVFPILPSGDNAQKDSGLRWRSIRDGGWYIPDKITLESVFRGKIGLLNIPVKSVGNLQDLFSALDCTSLLLSNCVRETVEPRGNPIRDVVIEKELGTRLEHISQLSEAPDTGNIPPSVWVWCVTSITVIRKLGDLKISADDGLVTVQEDDDGIDIYLPLVIPEVRRAELNYELEDHFAKLLKIEDEHRALSGLLMSAPVSQLSKILERHDISPPSGISDGETSESADTTDSDDATSVYDTIEGSINELIPSHRSRTQEISQRANSLEISDFIVARSLGRPHRVAAAERFSGSRLTLPTRTLGVRATVSVGNPEQERGSTSGGSDSESIRSPSPRPSTAMVSRGNIPWPASSGLTPRYRERDRLVPAVELRWEIGFHGELLIHKFFERRISDWTFENWTSKLRSEAGHPRFTEKEKQFTDFTYHDASGFMKAILGQLPVQTAVMWSPRTTYHLEVKTTTGASSEPCFVSQSQLDMMRAWDEDPDSAYILVRVSDIDGKCPRVKLYPRPWALYKNDVLKFKSEGGYKVYGKDKTRDIKVPEFRKQTTDRRLRLV